MRVAGSVHTIDAYKWEGNLPLSGSATPCLTPNLRRWLPFRQQRPDRFWQGAAHSCVVTCADQRNEDSPLHLDVQHVLANRPSTASLASILRRCGASKAFVDGTRIHEYIKKHKLHHNIFISNCLVLMYAQCERMEEAQLTFNTIPTPNSYSWSILITGYALNNKLHEARHVLARMPRPDVVAYNTMIAAYAKKQQAQEAIDLFWKMLANGIEPDEVTLVCTLEACSSFSNLEEAQEFLAYIKRSTFAEQKSVKTAFITLLGKFGQLDDGWEIFSSLLHRDDVSWNAMIAAYAQNGHSMTALNLYFQMRLQGMVASRTTLVCILDACTTISDLKQGLRIHNITVLFGYEADITLGISLIHMYGKCGSLTEARDSFSRMASHTVVSWTALMTACAKGNQEEEALDIFYCMQYNGFDPNEVTLTCALDVCASLAALKEGICIHVATVCKAYEDDELIGTALVHMYGKCGLVNDARCVFNRMDRKDAATWNAMLTVCAQSGHGKATLEHFEQMQTAGLRPNNVSFTCILAACSHMGWVDDGRWYFRDLNVKYSLSPTSEHCACMIDLLSRAGCLEEAEAFLDHFSTGKLAALWTSLLANCKIHGDPEQGLYAADEYTYMEPMGSSPCSSPFVTLANCTPSGSDFDQCLLSVK